MTERKMNIQDIDGDDVVLDNNGDVHKITQRVQEPPRPVKRAPNLDHRKDWVLIVMEDNTEIPPNGQFFGYNGQTYILKSGVEALVPPGLLEILNNATVTVPRIDQNTLQVVGWRDKLRYPYRRVLHRDRDRAA
jgi:hypothetical protein